jgi:hypothetical protein
MLFFLFYLNRCFYYYLNEYFYQLILKLSRIVRMILIKIKQIIDRV